MRAAQKRRYTFGNDEFNLEDAYHDCKLVFDGITDDDSFQEADTGLILYYANEIIYALQEALEGKDTNVPTNGVNDMVSRQTAIETVSNLASSMSVCSNIDESHGMKRMQEMAVMVLSRLPSAEPEQKTGRWINGKCDQCGEHAPYWPMASTYYHSNYCPNCGSYNGGESE